MKKILLALIFALLVSGLALAQGPYLVSDPYPAGSNQSDEFVIMLNGTEHTVTFSTDTDGLRYLRFDLHGLWNEGQNDLTARSAKHVGGICCGPFRIYCGRPWRGGGPLDCFVRPWPIKERTDVDTK